MIGVVDYGMGNLKSVMNALRYVGYDSMLITDTKGFDKCSHIILPGVGAFRDAIRCINESGLVNGLKDSINKGKHILGICLGMQMLFDRSYEDGDYEGLGIMKGEVVRFNVGLKVPHMGWNDCKQMKESKLFDGIDNMNFYFVHSYYVKTVKENILTTTDYGIEFTSSVEKDNIHAVQFHPEKSGDSGLRLIKNFGGLR